MFIACDFYYRKIISPFKRIEFVHIRFYSISFISRKRTVRLVVCLFILLQQLQRRIVLIKPRKTSYENSDCFHYAAKLARKTYARRSMGGIIFNVRQCPSNLKSELEILCRLHRLEKTTSLEEKRIFNSRKTIEIVLRKTEL